MRGARGVAYVRELWRERDRLAALRDIAPGRLIPDSALVDMAQHALRRPGELPDNNRGIGRYRRDWLAAIERAAAIPEADLPTISLPHDGPPPVRAWAEKDPVAAARLAKVRADLAEFGERHVIPIENVCSPDPLRRVIWSPPVGTPSAESFDGALAEFGVRAWQRAIVVPLLQAAFTA